jgi:hypothetical protein
MIGGLIGLALGGLIVVLVNLVALRRRKHAEDGEALRWAGVRAGYRNGWR